MDENMKRRKMKTHIGRQLNYGFEDENETTRTNAGKIANKWKLQCYICEWKDE